MAYQVYKEDTVTAAKYSVPNTTFAENCARTGARRMGWAMATAWREVHDLKGWDDLPNWMKKVLEEHGPD